jgi:hypothetical protein
MLKVILKIQLNLVMKPLDYQLIGKFYLKSKLSYILLIFIYKFRVKDFVSDA